MSESKDVPAAVTKYYFRTGSPFFRFLNYVSYNYRNSLAGLASNVSQGRLKRIVELWHPIVYTYRTCVRVLKY